MSSAMGGVIKWVLISVTEKNSQNQVLVVDDSRVIRRAAMKILQKDFDVIEAEDGEEAWEELQRNPNISVVFSDLGMPVMDGFELLEKIRNAQDPALAKVPVIIITGAEESDGTKEEVLELGATDFISKPFDSISLKTRAAANINYRNEVQSLEKRVGVDKLTGLLTEDTFMQQGEQALAYAQRHCTEVSLVRFDIEHFAEVFIKHGKEIAEQILLKISGIINEGKRTEDIAARLGVSRFALILHSSDPKGAEIAVSRICQRVARLKLKMGSDVFNMLLSTGITTLSMEESGIDFVSLLNHAENAHKKAAEKGGGKIIRYKTAVQSTEKAAVRKVDVNLEELTAKIKQGASGLSDEQLASAMLKILPLLEQSDKRLKLGLGKVIMHIKNRLQR